MSKAEFSAAIENLSLSKNVDYANTYWSLVLRSENGAILHLDGIIFSEKLMIF